MKVGDTVTHKLAGWEGIIVLDLRDNPWCARSEEWKVRFWIDEKLETKHCHGSELQPTSEADGE